MGRLVEQLKKQGGGTDARKALPQELRVGRAWPDFWYRGCVGAGQADRAETLALGTALASIASGDPRLGRRHPERVERLHHLQDLSGTAAWQSVRPLRHGARWNCRLCLRQS